MKVQKTPECWLWTASKDKHGYGKLSRSRKDGPILASRASWEINVGPIPGGLHVLHSCDNPSCVRPDHLFLGDAAANMIDKKNKGRAQIEGLWLKNLRAALSKLRKLSDAQCREVVQLRQQGLSLVELGKAFGVHHSTISLTLKRYHSQRH